MIELPDDIGPASLTMGLIDYGGVLRPALGGPLQRVNRLGSRFRASVSLPPLEGHRAGAFRVRLVRAKAEGLRMEIPLQQAQGAPGAPVVDGAGQAGTSIDLRGLTPGYVGKEGYWLSIVKDGQHYVHMLAAAMVVASDGTATASIVPALRTAFPDGAVVHLSKPMIEGVVLGDEMAWEVSLARHTMLSFDIEEAA
jgi:hypothetical protein